MKKLLLPTDFSGNSRNAISYALQLYSDETCEFTLLHAYKVKDYEEDSMLTPIPSKPDLEKAKLETDKKLESFVEELKQETNTRLHSFNTVSVNNKLVSAVKEQLPVLLPELVIIGTHGHTGSDELMYGSNTRSLMEEISNCPILAVPAPVRHEKISEIVLANSFKVELAPGDLEFLLELSRKEAAPVRVLHITEEGGLSQKQKENRKQLKENLNAVPHSFHSLEFLSIPLGIYAFTESRGSGMIAFINKKHSFFENLMLNPLYQNLGHYSRVPVLVLHQP
ncbi:MAG: universal stress protein [Salinimicrobium sp.]